MSWTSNVEIDDEEEFYKHIPQTLVVSADGVALRWISYKRYAYYKSRDSIVWSLGKKEYELRGGINAKTMKQSTLPIESIIAVKNNSNSRTKMNKPTLTNNALFNRDNNQCAYCGGYFNRSKLTRDHIIPLSMGGPDNWLNTVCACFQCNQKKGNKLLEECGMELLFQPYQPSHYENLIIKNKKISDEQLDYLIIGVSPHSRVYKDYLKRKESKEISE